MTLADQIFELLGLRISPSTVQRFFELVANKSFPTEHTLNVFSEYAGCTSWDDFMAKYREDVPISNNMKLVPDQFGLLLFQLCLNNQHFDTVLQYVEMLSDEHMAYPTKEQFGTALGRSLRNNVQARKYLLEPLAKSKAGRSMFYENFVDIDYLHAYYLPAIQRHYTKYISPLDRTKYNSDYVFAKALEFIAFVKLKDRRKAIACAYALLQKFPIQSDWREFSHPYPYSRLLGIYLINEHLKKALTSVKVDYCLGRLEELVPAIEARDRLWVISQVAMALNYCGRSEDIVALYQAHMTTIHKLHPNTTVRSLMKCIERAADKLGISTDIPPAKPLYQFISHERSLREGVLLI